MPSGALLITQTGNCNGMNHRKKTVAAKKEKRYMSLKDYVVFMRKMGDLRRYLKVRNIEAKKKSQRERQTDRQTDRERETYKLTVRGRDRQKDRK